MGYYDDLADSLMERALSTPGSEERPSRWQESPSLWVDGREIMHFEGEAAIDLRLTRRTIRELSASLKEDPRVELRRGTSDWLTVSVATPADVDFALELIARAVEANRR